MLVGVDAHEPRREVEQVRLALDIPPLVVANAVQPAPAGGLVVVRNAEEVELRRVEGVAISVHHGAVHTPVTADIRVAVQVAVEQLVLLPTEGGDSTLAAGLFQEFGSRRRGLGRLHGARAGGQRPVEDLVLVGGYLVGERHPGEAVVRAVDGVELAGVVGRHPGVLGVASRGVGQLLGLGPALVRQAGGVEAKDLRRPPQRPDPEGDVERAVAVHPEARQLSELLHLRRSSRRKREFRRHQPPADKRFQVQVA